MHIDIRKMNQDPGILCVNHSCGAAVFGFSCPTECPSCHKNLSDSTDYPFRIPYPFIRASQSPCSVVLKPTRGDFLKCYRSTDDLHIGVTSSTGVVYAYDEHGLGTDDESCSWSQCLAVPTYKTALQLQSVTEPWDTTLEHFKADTVSWNAERYREDGLNCYSFVLAFLRTLNIEISDAASDKATFCQRILLPHTTAAAKYITIYRHVIANGTYTKSN
ncbi:hypothetical protein B566_EDAN001415 [Ephemera danica]|nr:hypothetical protein B566_EDAN001415 [Ephemera danica]